MNNPVYNNIGQNYNKYRRADPRITKTIAGLLNLPAGATVADIGAGTGNYSRALADAGYNIVAIEPSDTMMAQATPHPNVQWAYGIAENIPLADASVDGVVALFSIHHFSSRQNAMAEMTRICKSGPVLIFTFEPRVTAEVWIKDYFPGMWQEIIDTFPPIEQVEKILKITTAREVKNITFPLPHDLEDHFLTSGWRRPEIYLDEEIRRGISSFALGDQEEIAQGLYKLQSDIDNGTWKQKYGAVLEKEELDCGRRFLVAI